MPEKGPREVELTDEEAEQEVQRLTDEKNQRLRQTIEKGFGKETLEVAEHTSYELDKIIKMHLLEKKDKEEASEALLAWRQFADRTYQRLVSENLKDPEMVETVLRMATALVQPEANREGEKDVKKGLKLIRGRYGAVEKE